MANSRQGCGLGGGGLTTGALGTVLVAAELLAELEGAATVAGVVAEGAVLIAGADAEGPPEEVATPEPEC